MYFRSSFVAAGKTSILYKLKLNENVHTIPTIGFNMEEVQVKNIKFVVWDVGGQKKVCKLLLPDPFPILEFIPLDPSSLASLLSEH